MAARLIQAGVIASAITAALLGAYCAGERGARTKPRDGGQESKAESSGDEETAPMTRSPARAPSSAAVRRTTASDEPTAIERWEGREFLDDEDRRAGMEWLFSQDREPDPETGAKLDLGFAPLLGNAKMGPVSCRRSLCRAELTVPSSTEFNNFMLSLGRRTSKTNEQVGYYMPVGSDVRPDGSVKTVLMMWRNGFTDEDVLRERGLLDDQE